ncbi:hypothetical protein B296_00034976 [Ensete ventricosum]|uniref:Uncharacterized protein n=1 Tax=Ensete ventricosum TaxID=4639 RepID=A0A427A332_ENSVE|nr:hypothetical protein B296_00034976 [Ensete ventricosum]
MGGVLSAVSDHWSYALYRCPAASTTSAALLQHRSPLATTTRHAFLTFFPRFQPHTLSLSSATALAIPYYCILPTLPSSATKGPLVGPSPTLVTAIVFSNPLLPATIHRCYLLPDAIVSSIALLLLLSSAPQPLPLANLSNHSKRCHPLLPCLSLLLSSSSIVAVAAPSFAFVNCQQRSLVDQLRPATIWSRPAVISRYTMLPLAI